VHAARLACLARVRIHCVSCSTHHAHLHTLPATLPTPRALVSTHAMKSAVAPPSMAWSSVHGGTPAPSPHPGVVEHELACEAAEVM
jgi:hypothetical protein